VQAPPFSRRMSIPNRSHSIAPVASRCQRFWNGLLLEWISLTRALRWRALGVLGIAEGASRPEALDFVGFIAKILEQEVDVLAQPRTG